MTKCTSEVWIDCLEFLIDDFLVVRANILFSSSLFFFHFCLDFFAERLELLFNPPFGDIFDCLVMGCAHYTIINMFQRSRLTVLLYLS